MWGAIVAAVGGVAGGIIGSITASQAAKKQAEAYREAANKVKSATEKYSGKNAYEAMVQKGEQEANFMNNRNLASAANRDVSNASNKMANVADVSDANNYLSGYNLGAQNEKSIMDGKYNAETAEAQMMMNQADITAAKDQATMNAVTQGIGGLANAYGQLKPATWRAGSNASAYGGVGNKNGIGTYSGPSAGSAASVKGGAGNKSSIHTWSDENVKEYDNHNGLPKADAEDALRQIESISYKYKDGLGQDQDHHVGVTAQSLEGTAFDDVVSENENGIKQLDKQKLQESVMAGIAALQKEIDELKGGKNVSK